MFSCKWSWFTYFPKWRKQLWCSKPFFFSYFSTASSCLLKYSYLVSLFQFKCLILCAVQGPIAFHRSGTHLAFGKLPSPLSPSPTPAFALLPVLCSCRHQFFCSSSVSLDPFDLQQLKVYILYETLPSYPAIASTFPLWTQSIPRVGDALFIVNYSQITPGMLNQSLPPNYGFSREWTLFFFWNSA